MKNAGKVVCREDLLRDAWGWEYLTETKTVDTHIKRLRDKISGAGYDSGPSASRHTQPSKGPDDASGPFFVGRSRGREVA